MPVSRLFIPFGSSCTATFSLFIIFSASLFTSLPTLPILPLSHPLPPRLFYPMTVSLTENNLTNEGTTLKALLSSWPDGHLLFQCVCVCVCVCLGGFSATREHFFFASSPAKLQYAPQMYLCREDVCSLSCALVWQLI